MSKPKLYEKLLEIQKSCNYFKKESRGYNFNYVSGSQILSIIRQKMDELGVLLFTEIHDYKTEIVQIEEKGKLKNKILTNLQLKMVWYNCEDAAKLEVPWYAQGLKDTEQGVGNALTYAERYFLLKSFKVPTDEDDPDHWEQKQEKAAKSKIEKEIQRTIQEKSDYLRPFLTGEDANEWATLLLSKEVIKNSIKELKTDVNKLNLVYDNIDEWSKEIKQLKKELR